MKILSGSYINSEIIAKGNVCVLMAVHKRA